MKEEIIQNIINAFEMEREDANEIFESYLSAFEENLKLLTVSLESKNMQDAKRAAHTIKGCALNCGDNVTAEIAIRADSAAKAENYDLCLKEAQSLQSRFDQF